VVVVVVMVVVIMVVVVDVDKIGQAGALWLSGAEKMRKRHVKNQPFASHVR